MRRPALLAACAALAVAPAIANARPLPDPPPEPTVDVEVEAVVIPAAGDEVVPAVPAIVEPPPKPEPKPAVIKCGLSRPPREVNHWHGGISFGGGEIGPEQGLFSFGVETGYRWRSFLVRTDYTFGIVSSDPKDLRREGAFHRVGAGLRWIFAEPERIPLNLFGDAGLGRRWLDPRRGPTRTSSDLELALGFGIGGARLHPAAFGSAIRVAVQITRADDPSAAPKAACAGSPTCGASDDRYGVSIVGTWNVYFAR